jgi:hypothetical protein
VLPKVLVGELVRRYIGLVLVSKPASVGIT